jgi:hypothetical protein
MLVKNSKIYEQTINLFREYYLLLVYFENKIILFVQFSEAYMKQGFLMEKKSITGNGENKKNDYLIAQDLM